MICVRDMIEDGGLSVLLHNYSVFGKECLLSLAFVPVERKAVIENDTDFQQTSNDFEQHMRDLKVQFVLGLGFPSL